MINNDKQNFEIVIGAVLIILYHTFIIDNLNFISLMPAKSYLKVKWATEGSNYCIRGRNWGMAHFLGTL